MLKELPSTKDVHGLNMHERFLRSLPPVDPEGTETELAEEERSLAVLLVDDDCLFLESLSDALRAEKFVVNTCGSGSAALQFFREGGECDVVLLDLHLSDSLGIDIADELQKKGISVPIVILTAYSDDTHEERALATGVEDFVDKSRPLQILVGRIRAAARRRAAANADGHSEPLINVGPLTLRPDHCRAYWRGQRVQLTLTEYRIVHELATRAGCEVAYRDIYDEVHGTGFVAGDGHAGLRTNVRSLIKRIRKKFHTIDPEFCSIESYPGFGYHWRASGS
jgi:two-component system response regulator ChvI